MKKIRISSLLLLLSQFVFSCREKPSAAVLPPAADTVPVTIISGKDSIPETALLPFVPAGYKIMIRADGDLNGDSLGDVILALNKVNEDFSSEESRPLLLLIRQKDNSLKQARRNDSIMYCAGCGGIQGPPYEEISIRTDGTFSISHYGGSRWRWTNTEFFRYVPSKNNWQLFRKTHKTEDMTGEDPVLLEETKLSEIGEVWFEQFSYGQ